VASGVARARATARATADERGIVSERRPGHRPRGGRPSDGARPAEVADEGVEIVNPDSNVFVADEQVAIEVDSVRWARLARRCLGAERVRGDVQLSMLFVDETVMADLNAQFLGKQGPTDVLSFPIDEDVTERGRQPDNGGRGPGDSSPSPTAPEIVGDIVLCPSYAARQAEAHGRTLDDELALLVVHGVLHLCGYDHVDDEEAEEMERREQELLERFWRGDVQVSGS
jgi:probable rRNA maturation factor